MPTKSPTPHNTKRTVAAIRKALANAPKTPRIKIKFPPNVPVFTADPYSPDIIIRKLNGKTEYGTMRGNRFVAKRKAK